MTLKSTVLSILDRDDLKQIVDAYGIDDVDLSKAYSEETPPLVEDLTPEMEEIIRLAGPAGYTDDYAPKDGEDSVGDLTVTVETTDKELAQDEEPGAEGVTQPGISL